MTSTPVTVAKAMRGSRSSSLMIIASSRCSSALTRSARLYPPCDYLGFGWTVYASMTSPTRMSFVSSVNAALETRRDLAHVVLHSAQRLDVPVVRGLAAAQQRVCTPRRMTPSRDAAAGDRRLAAVKICRTSAWPMTVSTITGSSIP